MLKDGSINKHISYKFSQRDVDIVDIIFVLEGAGSLSEKKFLLNNDLPQGTQMANYVFSLIGMGSKEDSTPEEFREKLNKRRIKFDIYQNKNDIHVSIKCLKKDLECALPVIFNAIKDPNLSSDVINNIKIASNIVEKQINSFEQSNDAKASYYFFKHLFAGMKYEPSYPNKTSSNYFNESNAHEYMQQVVLSPERVKILMVGDFKDDFKATKTSFESISKIFTFKDSEKTDFINEQNILFENLKKDKVLIEEGKNNEQSIIHFAHKSLKISDKDYLKLNLLMDHLGGRGLESLLMKEIREKKA